MPIGVRVVTIFVWSRLTSERRASNQRNQRESSDKHLHDTSPCYGRSSVGCCNSGEVRAGSNIAKLLRFLLSSAAKGGSRSLITEMIFYDIIDRNIGLMPCWILSCCAPSL